MTHGYWYVEATEVGDDRHTEGLDAAVMGHDDLRNGTHTYRITTQRAVHPVFGRCLEGGSLYAYIHTMHHIDALLLSNLVGLGNQSEVVRLVHVGESRTRREVLPTQRVFGEEIDMIGDDHQVADLERGIHAARRVAHEEGLDAQLVHHADGEGDLFHGVAFIKVETPLHGHDILVTKLSEDELPGVALYR